MVMKLLSKLLQKGVRLSAADGQLKIQTGNVSLSEEDSETLKTNKKAILAYLQNRKISCLSYAQERLWFLTQLGYSDQYHISKVVKIRGNLDQNALQKTMDFLISRHESLRTAFKTIDGTAAQVIEAAPEFTIEQKNLDELSRDQQDRESQILIREFVRRPFILEQAPLIRVILLRPEETLHILGICLHHIIADGWSLDLLTREINRVYRAYAQGKAPQMNALPIRYSDYAVWQREVMTGAKLEEELNYWKNHLAGYEELNLPTDFPRPNVLSGRGGSKTFILGNQQTRLLQKQCLEMQMTQFTLFMAAVYILLGRYSRQEDICLGMPVANRNRQEIEDVVGFFVNTLVIRIARQEEREITVRQLLKKVKKLLAAAQDRQNVPFEKVVEILQPDRNLNRTPIFQVLVNYVRTSGEMLQLGDCQTEEVSFDYEVSKFDLTFSFSDQTHGSVGIRLRYSRDLFAEETIVRMGEHLVNIIAALVNRPEQTVHEIQLLTGEEKQKLLIEWNDTATAYPADKRIQELFADQVYKTADRVALVCAVPAPGHAKKDVNRPSREWPSPGQGMGITYITYRQLDEKSSQLGQLLRRHGIGSNQVVAVMSAPGPEIITAILAVLKCEACYLPIDPSIPGTRLRYLLTDSKVALILTQTHLLEIAHHAAPGEMLAGILDMGAEHAYMDVNGRNGHPIDKMNTTVDIPPAGKCRKSGEPVYIIYTSGTSGKPKGVPITHENLVNYVAWFSGKTHLTGEDKTVLTSSFAFDLGYTSLYPPLLRGAQLHILPQEAYVLPHRFLDYLWFHHITYLKMTSSLFSTLVEDSRFSAQKCRLLRLVVLGGEAINTAAVENAFKICPHLSFMNHYGPTEVTIGCIARFIKGGEIDAYKARPTIGKPIDNIKAFILDRYLQVLPMGMAGELCLSGAGVAPGYLNQPALTSEKFISRVPDSFKNSSQGITHGHFLPHARLYRTGDLARWLADGNVEFMGRIDEQVKIRGFRIECGEIEAVLTGHPHIREAVVIAGRINNSLQLTAYYTVLHQDTNKPITAGELRAYLRDKLPEYMIPLVFVAVKDIPLTPNGKVDRKALSKHETELPGTLQYTPPRSETETQLARIWEEVLNKEPVGIHDNFFELGGHSLLAIRIISRINQDLEVEIPLRKLFEAPTIEGLSRLLAEHNPYRFIPISSFRRPALLPLSYAQERLWFLAQLGYSEHYHIPVALKIKGYLDYEALQNTFRFIIARHESLRTGFKTINDRAAQVIAAVEEIEINIEQRDLSGLNLRQKEKDSQDFIREFVHRPFKLEVAPLLRVALIRMDRNAHILGICLHHIISDAWSRGILTREISQVYNALSKGKEPQLATLTIRYADYAVWQREVMTGEKLDEELNYWKKQLEGYENLNLPTDFPRPKELSGRGGHARSRIDTGQLRYLTMFCQEKQVTLFTLLLTGVYILLKRYCGQGDICMGMPVANRNHPEIEDLIGFFVNTLVIRINMEENRELTIAHLLKIVQAELAAAQDRQNVPFEKVVEALQPDRDLSRTPIFQVLVNYMNTRLEKLQLGDSQSERMNIDYGISKFDLTVTFFHQIGGGLGIHLRYSRDLYKEGTIERMKGYLVNIINSLAKEPEKLADEIELLTEQEKQMLLMAWNDTAAPYPKDQCIHELVGAQAGKGAGKVACVLEDRHISYGELDERSTGLAIYLQGKGVRPDVCVGICLERSIEMIIGIMGILKAGGAYMPIDARYPAERIQYMLADSNARVLVTSGSLENKLKEIQRKPGILFIDRFDFSVISSFHLPDFSTYHSSNLAYVIYTSGSTGKPKGVMIQHDSAVNYLNVVKNRYGFNDIDDPDIEEFNFSFLGNFVFDAVATSFLVPLISGSTCIIYSEREEQQDIILKAMNDPRVQVIKLTPAHIQLIQDCLPVRFPTKKIFIIGGESLKKSQVNQLLDKNTDNGFCINQYGPTECTIASTAHLFNRGSNYGNEIYIGRPIENTRIYILSHSMKVMPIGVPGELVIGGDGLARGYLNQVALTFEKFINYKLQNTKYKQNTNPKFQITNRSAAGERRRVGERGNTDTDGYSRIYMTGDLGRWLGDGNIEFLGRIDQQVKIRGFRVECGEIAAVLTGHPCIQDAAVLARQINRTMQLAAFLVIDNDNKKVDTSEIRSYLQGKVPEYMIPSVFVLLEALPLTPSGKIDRKALLKQEVEVVSSQEYAVPRSEAEKRLTRIWEDVLNKKPIGINDNFFELGGHSLLAIRIISRINQNLEMEIPLRKLFEAPTIKGLSGLLAESNPFQVIPISSIRRPAHLPLSFAQERLWFLVQLGYSEYYHIPRILKIKGELDKEALQKTMNYLAARHESLRTWFKTTEGTAVQVITAALEIAIEQEDLSGLSKEEQESKCQDLIHEFIQRPFDLEKAPLIRIALIKLEKNLHILGICLHHIISDAWSSGILTREISLSYTAFSQGKEPPLTGLKVQYADYAVWQREIISGEKLEKELGYWIKQLAGYEDLNLPGDFPRPNELSGKGGRVKFRLEENQVKQLTGVCQKLQITLFSLLLTGVYILLAKYSRQEDICLGMTTANRNQREIEDIIGFFINTLVIRINREEKGSLTVEQLLKTVNEKLAAAQDRQDVPFGKVVEALQPVRDLSRTPIFQVLVNYINTKIEILQLQSGDSQLEVEGVEYDYGKSKFDLTFAFIDRTDGGLGIQLKYSRDLFEENTIEKMGRHLLQIIFSLVAKPGQAPSEIQLLTKVEKEKLLLAWNATTADYPGMKYFHELFQQQVKQGPDRIALMGPEPGTAGPMDNEAGYTAPSPVRHAVTYRLLNEKSRHLAQLLRSQGIAPHDVVAIMTEPCLEMITAILAILISGACYLPIDPENPGNRIAFLLTDSNARCLLTQPHLLETEDKVTVKDQMPGVLDIRDEHLYSNLNRDNHTVPVKKEKSRPGQPAYLIYTSGTTGKPKGVLVTHDNLVNYVTWFSAQAGLTAEDKSILTSSIVFDLGYTSLYPPLATGAQLHILPKDIYIFAGSLLEHIRVHGISYMKMTPSLFSTIVEDSHFSPKTCRSLRLVVLGGEAINAADVERTFNKCRHLHIMNHYGPTEVTIGCIAQSINPVEIDTYKTRPTIGKPIYNTKVFILDNYLQLLPIGLAGELCLCGAGTGRGYLNRPELTAGKFVRAVIDGRSLITDHLNNFSTEIKGRRRFTNNRLYRTGDLARWLENGNIEFLGRIDHLVKIRGFRVECGEIETVLCGYTDVHEAVVIARDVNNSTQLVAYCVTARRDKPLEINEIRGYLQDKLPTYMIPAAFVCLEAVPLTPNGKVDRKALLTYEVQLQSSREYAAPRNEIEKQLTDIWEEVLGVERVGIYDDFFELGGHSLLAIQMVTKIRQRMEVDCPLKHIFDHATVSELASLFPALAETAGDKRNMLEANIPGKKRKPHSFIPLSEGQLTFWLIWLAKKDTWNLYRIYDARGPFDPACLEQAFNALLQRHESLWVRFSRRRPLQEILPPEHIGLSVIDLTDRVPQEQEEELEKISRDVIVAPFDLTSPPLIRLCLVQLDDHWYKLILTAPHIVMDAAGFHTFIDEFMSFYKALASGNPLPPKRTEVRLSDYVYWKHAVSRQVRHQEANYWQQKLEKASLLRVPDLYLQKPDKTSRTQRIQIDKSLLAALAKISQQHRISLQMSLLAIIAMVLHHITSQTDISISIVFENRLHQDIKHLVSSLVTMVPLRICLSQETSFAELTDQIKHTTIEAYDHIRGSSFIPISLLTRAVRPDNHRFALKVQEHVLRLLTWVITRLWFSPKAYPHLFYAVLLGIDRKAYLGKKSGRNKSRITGNIASPPVSIAVGLNFIPDFYQSQDNSSYKCGDVSLSPVNLPVRGETRKALQAEQAGALYLAFGKDREGQPRFTVKGKMFTPAALQHITTSFDRILREVVKNPRITLQEIIKK